MIMACGSKHTMGKKNRLVKNRRKKQSLPTWIVLRTKGNVRTSPFSRRNWRSTKLDAS
jgi:ribosomal protein L39E